MTLRVGAVAGPQATAQDQGYFRGLVSSVRHIKSGDNIRKELPNFIDALVKFVESCVTIILGMKQLGQLANTQVQEPISGGPECVPSRLRSLYSAPAETPQQEQIKMYAYKLGYLLGSLIDRNQPEPKPFHFQFFASL